VAWRVYAIRSGEGGWPPEVWVVFASVDAAREYVDRARPEFRIETMPVYESYEECPIENRGLGTGSSAIALQSLGNVESDADRAAWKGLDDGAPDLPFVYAVAAQDTDDFDYTELELFYTTQLEAEEHVAHSYHMSMVVPFTLYRSYEECPPNRRFDGSGQPPGYSQLLRLKRQ
jgi:hypothetical protein